MKIEHDKMHTLGTDGEIDAIVKVGTYVKIEEGDDPAKALEALEAGINKKRRERAKAIEEHGKIIDFPCTFGQEERQAELDAMIAEEEFEMEEEYHITPEKRALLDEINQHLAENNFTFRLPHAPEIHDVCQVEVEREIPSPHRSVVLAFGTTLEMALRSPDSSRYDIETEIKKLEPYKPEKGNGAGELFSLPPCDDLSDAAQYMRLECFSRCGDMYTIDEMREHAIGIILYDLKKAVTEGVKSIIK